MLTKKKSEAEAEEMAKELLNRVGLIDKLHEMPGKLSGGQKQRLAIARVARKKYSNILLKGQGINQH